MTKPTLAFDTPVSLFSENSDGSWRNEWTGSLLQFFEGNEIKGGDRVEFCRELVTARLVRTGGGAAPTFELRFACEPSDNAKIIGEFK